MPAPIGFPLLLSFPHPGKVTFSKRGIEQILLLKVKKCRTSISVFSVNNPYPKPTDFSGICESVSQVVGEMKVKHVSPAPPTVIAKASRY